MALQQRYQGSVKTAVVAAAGLGIPGIFNPALDVAGTAGIWTTMVGALAAQSGHTISPHLIGKLVSAAVSGVSAYMLGSKILTWVATPLILAFPVAGIPAAALVNSLLNGLFTYRLGLGVASEMSRATFTDDDFIQLSYRVARKLTHLPSWEEIEAVRELISGS